MGPPLKEWGRGKEVSIGQRCFLTPQRVSMCTFVRESASAFGLERVRASALRFRFRFVGAEAFL